MKRIDVTIEESQIKQLKEHAKKTGLTRSAIIRKALELYFEKEKKP